MKFISTSQEPRPLPKLQSITIESKALVHKSRKESGGPTPIRAERTAGYRNSATNYADSSSNNIYTKGMGQGLGKTENSMTGVAPVEDSLSDSLQNVRLSTPKSTVGVKARTKKSPSLNNTSILANKTLPQRKGDSAASLDQILSSAIHPNGVETGSEQQIKVGRLTTDASVIVPDAGLPKNSSENLSEKTSGRLKGTKSKAETSPSLSAKRNSPAHLELKREDDNFSSPTHMEEKIQNFSPVKANQVITARDKISALPALVNGHNNSPAKLISVRTIDNSENGIDSASSSLSSAVLDKDKSGKRNKSDDKVLGGRTPDGGDMSTSSEDSRSLTSVVEKELSPKFSVKRELTV